MHLAARVNVPPDAGADASTASTLVTSAPSEFQVVQGKNGEASIGDPASAAVWTPNKCNWPGVPVSGALQKLGQLPSYIFKEQHFTNRLCVPTSAH